MFTVRRAVLIGTALVMIARDTAAGHDVLRVSRRMSAQSAGRLSAQLSGLVHLMVCHVMRRVWMMRRWEKRRGNRRLGIKIGHPRGCQVAEVAEMVRKRSHVLPELVMMGRCRGVRDSAYAGRRRALW